MDISILEVYVTPVIFVTCLCVGFIIKNGIKTDAVNRFIPLVVGVLGVALSAWLNMAITPEIVCAGLVSGLASTGAYELFAQLLYGHDTDGE